MSKVYPALLKRFISLAFVSLIPASGKCSFIEMGHDIFSTAIHSLALMQVGQLSVTGERMCTEYWLTILFKPAQEKCNYQDN